MKAVILAAGEGSRMRPLTYTRPKVMIPIANKPIMEHLIIAAAGAGINELILIVGYRDEQVRQYFGNGSAWGVKIDYCTQRKQFGTADALKMVEYLVEGNFLMINGDNIVSENDIRELSNSHENTISVVEVDHTEDLGFIELEGDRVVRIHEKVSKPPSRLANAGLYMFTPEIFNVITQTDRSPRGEYEITDSLQLLIGQGNRVSYRKIDYWLNLSYPWDLLVANEFLLAVMDEQNHGEIEENVVIRGVISVGKGTIIRSGSYIQGPVVIGKGCDIGPNCYIRPATAIGDNCRIGNAVEVKNSIVLNNSKIPHHNYVGDSIIGKGCNLGAGTKIANLRLDERDIWVAGMNTRRRKLGAIIGDGVQTGINSCINVGSIIGNNTHIGPGATVSGVISPNSVIY